MPKVPKPAKPSRKRLIKQLDKKMSEYVRLRDGACVICGRTNRLQAGHLITRGAYSVRWDEQNVNCQCSGCNYLHEYKNYIYELWFIKKFGVDTYAKLVERASKIRKWTVQDLTEQLALIEVRINQLGQK